jgi:pimeloyl-ACP methyl ester carboxylesterase
MSTKDVSVMLTRGAWTDGSSWARVISALNHRLKPHPQAPRLAPDSEGLIWLPEGAFERAFAQNASTDARAVLVAVQRPIPISCITVPASRPPWKDVPSWFLVAEDDRMIGPETQRHVAERMDAKIRAHRVDHAPNVTTPTPVGDIILDAVRPVAAS